MGGKPAARQGDGTAKGGPIVQGSAGVLIGAPTGVACSVCPGGMTSGNPVNPLLGAKVLPGETDIALPGPQPFVLSRSYSSYQTRTPAPVGVFGPGWKAPSDIRLQRHDEALILNDNGGRSLYFEPLSAGEVVFSRSESLWLARGGTAKLADGHPLARLWQRLPEQTRLSPHVYLATNSPQGPWWILGWCERVPHEDEALPAPLPPYRVLTGLADSFGRMLSFHRDVDGEFAGEITGVTDGAGRRFRLVLSTQAQRAEQYHQHRQQSVSTAQHLPDVTFAQTLPATGYGADSGIRLLEVWLTDDPDYPDNLPVLPLARYDYTPRGELAAVYDRSGAPVRHFLYDDRHPGRMVAHGYAGRPQTTYRYDASGRVVAQHNPQGLSYAYAYEKNAVTITDSFNRREVLHTEGEGGLKRVVREEKANGGVIRREFDNAGRLTAQTDAAGRRTVYRLNQGSGNVDAIITPDGRSTQLYYNGQQQPVATVFPDGLGSQQAYDDYGRLIADTSRSGDTTRYVYDDPGSELPSATEDATGSRKTMTWSGYGQLLTFTDCSGYETRLEYDRFGQMTAVHKEEGLSQYRDYDNRGRLVSQSDAQGHESRYDYNEAGDLTAVIHPDGSRSETRYDPAGHPVSMTEGGLTRAMEYDPAGRVTALINENHAVTTFAYDVMNQLIQETGFDGRTQRYHHDLTGKLTRSEDEDLITLWHYDASDRLAGRTVNGEEAEQWQYDERGWLTEISHRSDNHRVAVHYGYDDRGRLNSERQFVCRPESDERLWEHVTKHDYSAQGLVNKITPDRLPSVAWLTYGSGYLAGMKLGETPLLEFTRDRLHRESQRQFGGYLLDSRYTLSGQLQQSHTRSHPQLDRDYGYNDNGQLVRISGQGQQRDYRYDGAGRLISARLKAGQHDYIWQYASDPAGNRVTGSHQPPALPAVWQDNRTGEDAAYCYRYDPYGRLTEKSGRGNGSSGDTHHYEYDLQHRLAHYSRRQEGVMLLESRYLYDPLGRRVGKRVWRNHGGDEHALPDITWYGWDGDQLTTEQTESVRIQTIYTPGSFTPLVRVETETAALNNAIRRSLAEKLQQEAGMTFVAELVARLDGLEAELRCGQVSEQSRQWLAQCGLSEAQLAEQVEAAPEPGRKVHLYHCDHRGLPLALIGTDGETAWSAQYDEWGNQLAEDNPYNLRQRIRLPGQQYDEETGLYYNRHRYYDPEQGRYVTQDPIGLRGGWNLYQYPLNPIVEIDPLGLNGWNSLQRHVSQDGFKFTHHAIAAQVESTIPKPTPEWKFIRWSEDRGQRFGNRYVNFNVICEDQFGNTKSVNARTFQTGWFTINEPVLGTGIPDPGEDSSDIASGTGKIIDSVKGIYDAHNRAVTCGSKSNSQCFKDTEATPELGNKLCGQR